MALILVLILASAAAAAPSNRYTSLHHAHKQKVKAVASASSCGSVENHTAYLGHDVGGDPNPGTKVSSLAECCDLCNANDECRFLTYNAPTCFLKTSDARLPAPYLA